MMLYLLAITNLVTGTTMLFIGILIGVFATFEELPEVETPMAWPVLRPLPPPDDARAADYRSEVHNRW